MIRSLTFAACAVVVWSSCKSDPVASVAEGGACSHTFECVTGTFCLDGRCSRLPGSGSVVECRCGMGRPCGASGACLSTGCRSGFEDADRDAANGCEKCVVAGSSVEVCDGIDNDCNGTIDDGVSTAFFRDADEDGFGNPGQRLDRCVLPRGFVTNALDCDDTRPLVHPGAFESCNGLDDDCNGAIDGVTRPCDSGCGPGTETCQGGVFLGCDAPPVTVLSELTHWTATAMPVELECLRLVGSATLEVDGTLKVRRWVHVDGTTTLRLAPGSTLVAADVDLSGALAAPRARIELDGGFRIGGDGKLDVRGGSGPGNSGCIPAGGMGVVGGGGGGARGGKGGRGGVCGSVTSQQVGGAGGPGAGDGRDGFPCNIMAGLYSFGADPSGGSGALGLAGGGGGANGGPGGAGLGGSRDANQWVGGDGGRAEAGASAGEPTTPGGGGGAGGAITGGTNETICDLPAGGGAGWLRLEAASFENHGTVQANGADATSNASGAWPTMGGGGGGAGGTLVFRVDRFINAGTIAAGGGMGSAGSAATAGFVGGCANTVAGPGGGGGGGRVYILGRDGTGLSTRPGAFVRGQIFFSGGAPRAAACAGDPDGLPGIDGWVYAP